MSDTPQRLLGDGNVLACLVTAEVALTRAWARIGVAPAEHADEVSRVFGWRGSAEPVTPPDTIDVAELARAAVAGGNPVIPLVPMMKRLVSQDASHWIHRGPTSQDIMDTALMLLLKRAGAHLIDVVAETRQHLARFALTERDTVAAGRTLTQHAVPTTVGLRAAGWIAGLDRAVLRLQTAVDQLPASLFGAGGTLASFVEMAGREHTLQLTDAFATELDLQPSTMPWHVTRWPVMELADALTALTSAFGVIAGDVATLSRTEIGELSEASGGGSSAMPQKSNPAASVLIRSGALRAPGLAATLRTASALAVDERPDGAWHAEWPTIRELMRLTLGVAETGRALTAGLRIDHDRVRDNLGMTQGRIVAERLAIVLTPIIGRERLQAIIGETGDLAELLRSEPAIAEAGIDVDSLVDPANYTGLASHLVNLTCKE